MNGLVTLTEKQKAELANHPDYNSEMDKVLKEVKIEGVDTDLQTRLLNCLRGMPFLSVGVSMANYETFVKEHPNKWTVLLLKKATEIVLGQSPMAVIGYAETDLDTYLVYIKPIYTLHENCVKALQEANNKVIQTLFLREKLKGK